MTRIQATARPLDIIASRVALQLRQLPRDLPLALIDHPLRLPDDRDRRGIADPRRRGLGSRTSVREGLHSARAGGVDRPRRCAAAARRCGSRRRASRKPFCARISSSSDAIASVSTPISRDHRSCDARARHDRPNVIANRTSANAAVIAKTLLRRCVRRRMIDCTVLDEIYRETLGPLRPGAADREGVARRLPAHRRGDRQVRRRAARRHRLRRRLRRASSRLSRAAEAGARRLRHASAATARRASRPGASSSNSSTSTTTSPSSSAAAARRASKCRCARTRSKKTGASSKAA